MITRLTFLFIAIFLILLLTSCRLSRVLFPEVYKGDDNWLMSESSHYFIYYRPNSPASQNIENIAMQLDSCYKDVLLQLGVSFSSRISYYLYNSSDDLERWAGWSKWGFFVGEYDFAVGIYPSADKIINSHETTHIIVYNTWGKSELVFLNEGLAETVSHCHEKNSSDKFLIHIFSKSLLWRDVLFPLDVLTDNDCFKQIYTSPKGYDYYQQCGSFVRYLIDEYGLLKFKSLFPRTSEENFRNIFRMVYGKSIEELDQEWREFLLNY